MLKSPTVLFLLYFVPANDELYEDYNMSTVISPTAGAQPVSAGEQHIIFRNSSWATYQRLLAEREGPRPRLAYDQGVLEIMTTSLQHEKLVRLFEALINALALALDIDFESTGETTFQRADLQRGFEPDGSYYINSLQQIRSRDHIDLSADPVPDLVIEVDFTSSSLNKQPIMATLGIGEIWHYRDDKVTILRLIDGDYQVTDQSLCFPGVTSHRLSAWILASQLLSRPAWLKQIQNEAVVASAK